MSDTPVYELGCDCGAVTMRAHGQPLLSVYCHCPSCRAFYDTAMAALTGWPEEQVELPAADQRLFDYQHPHKQMRRVGCAQCGSTLYGRHRPGIPVIPVGRFRAANGGTLPPELMPTLHLFYADRVIGIDDDLPKSQAAEALGSFG